jgi:hypothetical protein
LDIAEHGHARRRREVVCALSATLLLLAQAPAARAQASSRQRGGLSADEAPALGGTQATRRPAPGHGLAGDSPARPPDPPEITVHGFGPSLTREQEQQAIRDGWKR